MPAASNAWAGASERTGRAGGRTRAGAARAVVIRHHVSQFSGGDPTVSMNRRGERRAGESGRRRERLHRPQPLRVALDGAQRLRHRRIAQRRAPARRRAVAARIGYVSEFAFAKAFKREFGMAPGRYRERPSVPSPADVTPAASGAPA